MAPLKGAARCDRGAEGQERAVGGCWARTCAAIPIRSTPSNFHTENLFGLFVTQDLNRPDVTIPYLMQGGLGLPDKDYYVSAKPDMAEIRTLPRLCREAADARRGQRRGGACRPHRRAGEQDRRRAGHDRAEPGRAPARQSWKRADFAAKAPGIDWNAYWNAAGLPGQQDFVGVAAGRDHQALRARRERADAELAGLADLPHDQPGDARRCPRRSTTRRSRSTARRSTARPRSRRATSAAIAAVNAALGDAVGKDYADKYFPPRRRPRSRRW